MPRTAEHSVAMYRLARGRVDAGMPVWALRVNLADVFRAGDLPYAERRDTIVDRLRASAWLRQLDEPDPVAELVDDLAQARDEEEFDLVFDLLYDYADADRVWIRIR